MPTNSGAPAGLVAAACCAGSCAIFDAAPVCGAAAAGSPPRIFAGAAAANVDASPCVPAPTKFLILLRLLAPKFICLAMA